METFAVGGSGRSIVRWFSLSITWHRGEGSYHFFICVTRFINLFLQTKPIRTPRQTKQKEPDGSFKDTKEKRGRKRKVRDDELPVSEGTNGSAPVDHRYSSKKGKEEKTDKTDKSDQVPKKSTRTPGRHGQLQVTQETTPISTSAPPHSPSLSITPSLKIRLPRLSNLSMTTNSSISLSSSHLETPSRR